MAEEEKKKNPYHKEFGVFSNIRFILRAMVKYTPILIWLLPLGFVIFAASRYSWSFVSKYIIDIITNNGTVGQLFMVIGIFGAALTVIQILIAFYWNKQWVQAIMVRMYLILKINTKMMSIDFEKLEDPDILDCMYKGKQAASNNNAGLEGMVHALMGFITKLGSIILGFVILGSVNPLIALMMIGISLIGFLVSNWANKYGKKHIWDPLAPVWRKLNYFEWTLSNFSTAKDVRMYGLREWLSERYNEVNAIRYGAQKKNAILWFCVSMISSLLWIASQLFVYAYLVGLIYHQQITIANFTLYLASAGTLFSTISEVMNQVSEILHKSREIDDFRSFMELENLPGVAAKTEETQATTPVPAFDKWEFEFQNVSFKYPRAENYALKNLNLTLHAGERLAVVGLNGAGKTTFIKLLLRLYTPTEGKILLNGVDIQTFDKVSYYKVFAPVFQEVDLFAFSLRENVAMEEAEKIDNERVKKCLDDAGLADKVAELKDGIDTQVLKIIYDDGVDFSGGEKQKLSLARALYKNCPVVVLDEPTAALDALAESKLYQDFDKLIGGKTSVYISHRLSSTQFCNHVAMFEDGQLAEYGTHDELMKADGPYAKMFKVQSQYYVEDQEGSN